MERARSEGRVLITEDRDFGELVYAHREWGHGGLDIPGAQLRFAKAEAAQAPTKGRVLDHIGFDVKDLQSFVKKIEGEGIKLDEPVRKNEATGVALTYITDPWGTRIELVQRPPSP